MENAEITITLPVKQATQNHIESLQATLGKRNARIEQLEMQLAEAVAGEPNQAALGAAYKRGWRDACNKLMSVTHEAARGLSAVRKDAMDIYLEAEKKGFGE